MANSKRVPKFIIFQDAGGQWRWHLKAGNGRVIAQGESHHSERDALRAVRGVVASAGAAMVVPSSAEGAT